MLKRHFVHKTIARFLAILGIVLLGVMLSPWFLYQYGLQNVRVLSDNPNDIKVTSDEKAAVLKAFCSQTFVMPSGLNPWTYYFMMRGSVFGAPRSDEEASKHIVAFVASRYASAEGIKDKRGLLWHITGASLIIWIVNHWSEKQILSQAFLFLSKSKNFETIRSNMPCPR